MTDPAAQPSAVEVQNEQAKEKRALQTVTRQSVQLGNSGLPQLDTLEDMYRLADVLSKSGVVPEHFDKDPGAVMMVMMIASELKINMTTALQSFHYIVPYNAQRGKLSMPAEMMKTLIMRDADCESYNYGWEGEGEERSCWVQTKHKNFVEPFPRAEFSIKMARKAMLIKRDGNKDKVSNWTKYPDDMMLWRCVTRDAKRNWGGTISNMPSIEEMHDAGQQTLASPPPPVMIEVNAVPAEADPLLVEAEVVEAAPAEPEINAPVTPEPDAETPPDAAEEEEVAEPEVHVEEADSRNMVVEPEEPEEPVFCSVEGCDMQAHTGKTHIDTNGQGFTE